MQTLGGFTLGETVYTKAGNKPGVIEGFIPAVSGHGWMDHPAFAVVRWPDPRRIGGSGYRRTSVRLTGLVHEAERGTCDQCGKHSNTLVSVGSEAYPRRICGTCHHREGGEHVTVTFRTRRTRDAAIERVARSITRQRYALAAPTTAEYELTPSCCYGCQVVEVQDGRHVHEIEPRLYAPFCSEECWEAYRNARD